MQGVNGGDDDRRRVVFVSHASKDLSRVHEVVDELEERGIRCWIAPRDIRPSADYAQQIASAIESAGAFLLMFSANASGSVHCERELELAMRADLPILPVRLDETEPTGGFEYRLATVQWMDQAAPDFVPGLVRSLRDLVGGAGDGEGAVDGTSSISLAEGYARTLVPPHLSGREAEAQTLRTMLDDVVRQKAGRIVLIQGESGVGKSILADFVAVEAAERGFAIASTVCEPFHEGMSFFPVRELMRQLTSSGAPAADLAAIYGRGSVEASMAGVAELGTVDPSARRDAMLATFANLAIGTALKHEGRPVMLVIDDLERVDPGTTDSLLCLLARLHEAPVVIVGTFRSDVVAPRRSSHPLTPLLDSAARASDRFVELDIGPLGRGTMKGLVTAILDGPISIPSTFLNQLWDETEGNPLYVRELLRSLQDSRADGMARLLLQNGVWCLRGDVGAWKTPASVEEAIRSRLNLMDADSRVELEKASVIGKRFAFAVMMRLTETNEDELLERLEDCISLALIQETAGDEEAFEFTHGKIRDVLYESMSRIRRRKLHSVAADALLALRSTIAEDWEALIGEHLYQAGRYAEAAPLLASAAEALLRLSAAREASALLDKAIDAHVRSEGEAPALAALRLARVRALIAANEYDAARHLAQTVVEDVGSDALTQGWAKDFLGDIYWTTGKRVEALAAYEDAERIAVAESDQALELEVCADVTELCERASEQVAGVDDVQASDLLARSEAYLDRQIVLAAQSDDRQARARALRNEAKRLRRQGDVNGALAKYEAGIALTDPRVATHTLLISYAKTLRFAGRNDEAVAVVDRVLAWSAQSGARRSMGIALHYRALLVFELDGPVSEVHDLLDEALGIHVEIGYERGVWEVKTLLGEWYAVTGEWASAMVLFRDVLRSSDGVSDANLVSAVCSQLRAIDEGARAQRLEAAWEAEHG